MKLSIHNSGATAGVEDGGDPGWTGGGRRTLPQVRNAPAAPETVSTLLVLEHSQVIYA